MCTCGIEDARMGGRVSSMTGMYPYQSLQEWYDGCGYCAGVGNKQRSAATGQSRSGPHFFLRVPAPS